MRDAEESFEPGDPVERCPEIARARLLDGISVFLPCHNEEGNVERVVNALSVELPLIAEDYQIVIVDDGSADRTGIIADRLAATDLRIKAVHHQNNHGYGAAVISGVRACTQPWVVLCDGDGQFDANDIGTLAAKVPAYDVVVGYRVNRADSLMRRINGKSWTLLIRLFLDIHIKDLDCGLKLFKRELLEDVQLRAKGAMISAELMAQVIGRGAKICEIEVKHLPRVAGKQTGANFNVIIRAFRELFLLRRGLREIRRRA